jgi:hypothetical protein
MKKKKITLILFLAVSTLVLTMSSCKPDDPEPCYDCDKQKLARDTIYNNDTFLSYCFFPEGSWWIYQRTDTTATIYDTVTVISDRRFIYSDWTSYQNDFERIFQELKHTSISYGANDLLVESNECFYPDLASRTWFGEYFIFPFTEGKNNIGSGSIELYPKDSLILESGTFLKAIKVGPYVGLSTIWLVKDIGLAKISNPLGSTWELTQYYINK